MASSKDVLEKLYLRLRPQEPLSARGRQRGLGTLAASQPATVGIYLTRPGGGPANAFSRYGVGKTLLGFGSQALVEAVLDKGKVVAGLALADGKGGWGDPVPLKEAAASGKTLELAVPFAQFGQPETGDQIGCARCSAWARPTRPPSPQPIRPW